MAYVGNRNGPRESEIVARLGATYFGISPEELDAEIQLYRDDEEDDEVTPVRRDDDGRYYILFKAPEGGQQWFFLDEHGYTLEGDVRIWPKGVSSVEIKRDQ